MSLLSRTLLRRYFKVLFLTLFAFIAFLLTFRLKEIAELLAAGGNTWKILYFILLQIPSILPVALPISSLLAALLLFLGLSKSHELTTLRASGLSLLTILRPLLLASAALSLGNFILTSEIATHCHLASRQTIYELTKTNPLLLLQEGRLPSLKGAFIHIEPKKVGKSAQNLIIASSSTSASRLTLLLAQELRIEEDNLLLNRLTLLTPLSSSDSLLIENCEQSKGFAFDAAGLIHPQQWKLSWDHLNLRQLFAGIQVMKEIQPKAYQKKIQKAYSEMICRVSLAIAPLSFAFIGASFGIHIGRGKYFRQLILLGLTASLSLSSFFIAKEMDHLFALSTLLFLLPHLVIVLLAFRHLRKIEEGNDAAL